MSLFSSFQHKLILGACLIFILPLASCSGRQSEAKTSQIYHELPVETIKTNPKPVAEDTVRVGIFTNDSTVSVNERYSPLLTYLSEVTGRSFELAPLTSESQFTQVAEGEIDFTLNNPLAAVQIRRLHNTKFLATQSRPQTGTEFGGLIIVRSDSEIKKLEDLRGKKGACLNFQTAAAGCIFQIYHLRQRGIDPFTDFGSFVENKSQDNIVLAVLNGTIDFGFIRTGQLEKMAAKGLINSTEEVRILEPMEDGFFYKHTTALYPEWFFAATEDTDPELVKAVREALLNIPAGHPALKAAKLDGFVPATDEQELDKLIETLKLKSWDAK
ncbi:MAG: phosphate/phosphite/phosphonate ABC transporter substrate-binding protein [Coleofasciculaceae cyanobacterium]